jgi:hypothetical protein
MKTKTKKSAARKAFMKEKSIHPKEKNFKQETNTPAKMQTPKKKQSKTAFLDFFESSPKAFPGPSSAPGFFLSGICETTPTPNPKK